MKYFHKASNIQIEKLLASKGTFGDLDKEWKGPDWCNYGPGVLHGPMGCWSLMDMNGLRKKISPKFCQSCDCYIEKKKL